MGRVLKSQPLAQSTLQASAQTAQCALPTIPSAFAVKLLRHHLCKIGANVSMVESANQQPILIASPHCDIDTDTDTDTDTGGSIMAILWSIISCVAK